MKHIRNILFSVEAKLIINWPLQIVARLLSAAVQSHHPMALAPHILADGPLGGVARTSPQEGYSFFQLHSAERHIIRCVFRRTAILLALRLEVHWLRSSPAAQWCLFSTTATFNRWSSVLPAKDTSSVWNPKRKNCPFSFKRAYLLLQLDQSSFKNQSNTRDFQSSHLIFDTNCISLIKYSHWINRSGSLNDGFAVCHNIRTHWDVSLCHHSYLPR